MDLLEQVANPECLFDRFNMSVIVMYLASVVDNTTIDCFFEHQVIAPPLTRNVYTASGGQLEIPSLSL